MVCSLCHHWIPGCPSVVHQGAALRRALSVLDRTPAVETFKVGVIYVGAQQTTETQVGFLPAVVLPLLLSLLLLLLLLLLFLFLSLFLCRAH